MPNSLFNRFGNNNIPIESQKNQSSNNILSQFIQSKNNPGIVLDILLKNNKINQQQYSDLYPYRNNFEFIVKYLINNGHADEINSAKQLLQ